jgi:hypothetical protein
MKEDVISISDCDLTDSIYNIKNALEEPTICRVRKIFAIRYNSEPGEHPTRTKPTKKCFYIWVEWDNTNASCIFSARLRHRGEKALFKLDRWDQLIVTKSDQYGNPTEHAHWIAKPSSRDALKNAESYYGSRDNEEIWTRYLAPGESAQDTDDEEDKNEGVEEEREEGEQLHLINPLPFPELNHNSPILVPTPEPKHLSLFIPVADAYASTTENDDFIRENFVVIEPEMFYEKSPHALSCEQLKKLCKGQLDNDVYVFKTTTITFPDGNSFDICK